MKLAPISNNPAKLDKRICSNYRIISLIDVAAKVFGDILLKRFQSVREGRTHPLDVDVDALRVLPVSHARAALDLSESHRCVLR